MDGPTDGYGPTDGPMDGLMDGQTLLQNEWMNFLKIEQMNERISEW